VSIGVTKFRGDRREKAERRLFPARRELKYRRQSRPGVAMHAAAFIIPLFKVLNIAIDLYWWVIIVMAIMSWLLAFDVINMRNEFVRSIWNSVNALTEPALRPIRRFIPPIGGMDISPIILLLLLSFIQMELVEVVRALIVAA
jgi:YggT family protein